MRLEELSTPAAVVDLETVERNARRMSEHVSSLGARLRPHVKTHKCLEAARLQVRGHFGGITVSTLAEARAFAEGGFEDITYAVPISPARMAEAAKLSRSLRHLNLLIDHPDTAAALSSTASNHDVRLRVFLKFDCGYHRAGVDPESENALELARQLHEDPHLELVGVLTHAGHSYSCRNAGEIRKVASTERQVAVEFAGRLEQSGVPPGIVSIGSTPTVALAENLDGITEVRPGNYAFFDVFQATIGSCTLEDAAFSVLASVIGVYPSDDRFIIDAGALALSKDGGPRHVDLDAGFGRVLSLEGERLDHEVASLSQEHGVCRKGAAPLPRVGTKLRVLANHSCLAAAQHSRFHVVVGDEIDAEWQPVKGW